MTKNSYICNFIKENADWLELLDEKKISVREEYTKDDNHFAEFATHFAIFNYEIGADFTDPLTKEARGIIIDLKTLSVVCWPFTKFGNHFESYVDDIDWNSARVQEKIDGSIIKLWNDGEKWRFSTNKMITPDEKFSIAIEKAAKDIDFSVLSPDNTYILELVSPLTQVVIAYPETKFYHTGTRNNKTGQEIQEDIGLPEPKEFACKSLEECVAMAGRLNKGKTVDEEGYVVVDKDYHRIKVKSPVYVQMHHLTEKGSKKQYLDLLRSGADIDTITKQFPQKEEIILFYKQELDKLISLIGHFHDYYLNLYKDLSCDRKKFALTIKDNPMAFVGFSAINGQSSDEIILRLSDNKLYNMIPDYEFLDDYEQETEENMEL